MSKNKLFLSFAIACIPALNANATVVPESSTKDLSITVYNNGLGLVKDERTVSFKKGKNSLSFENVSTQIQSESALFSGKGLNVIEQNFDFDLLSRESLLKKYMGKKIKVLDTHLLSGKKTIEVAEVLSVDAGLVLKIDNRIETDYEGRLIFPDIPDDLYDKPTLSIEVDSKQAGNQDVKLSYLTNGLTWRADYVAELDDAEKSINLNGWVTLTNTSGIAYKNANLEFIAGSVNRVQPEMQPRLYATKSMAYSDGATNSMTKEELMDYHLYSLGRKATIASNQTKQLALLSANNVKVEKSYLFNNIIPTYRYSGSTGKYDTTNAAIVLSLMNDKASNLGLSLPAGVIRVYKDNSKQNTFFVGEDKISHTPENEEIKLSLGKAFDITVSGIETAYTSFSKKSYEASYELTFKNAKDKPVTVAYRQDFQNEWTVVNSSEKHKKTSSKQAEWKITIPAKGQTKLNFTVRMK